MDYGPKENIYPDDLENGFQSVKGEWGQWALQIAQSICD